MVKFANKPHGKNSKRQPLNMKYKIKQKVRDHKKKIKKEARQMKALGMIKKSKILCYIMYREHKGNRPPQSLPLQEASD